KTNEQRRTMPRQQRKLLQVGQREIANRKLRHEGICEALSGLAEHEFCRTVGAHRVADRFEGIERARRRRHRHRQGLRHLGRAQRSARLRNLARGLEDDPRRFDRQLRNSLLPCAPRVLAATLARRTHDSSCKRPAELTAPMLSLSVPYYRSKTKIENDLFDIPDGQSGQVKSGQPAWNEARESEAMRGRSNFVAAMGVVAAAMLASGGSAFAQKKYDAGASDTEIKIGNTGPYSGPNSIASSIPKTMAAYFKKINAEGGINGRKIDFISYDDAFSPPKSVE